MTLQPRQFLQNSPFVKRREQEDERASLHFSSKVSSGRKAVIVTLSNVAQDKQITGKRKHNDCGAL